MYIDRGHVRGRLSRQSWESVFFLSSWPVGGPGVQAPLMVREMAV